MVPEQLSGGGRRSVRIPPHDKHVARQTRGLEAALIDNKRQAIAALDPRDGRVIRTRVAGPAALIVAKLHKISDRSAQHRVMADKDAHDVYRLLVASEDEQLARSLDRLRRDELAGTVVAEGVELLNELFGAGPDAQGCVMAARTERGVGDPDSVSVASWLLARAVLDRLGF